MNREKQRKALIKSFDVRGNGVLHPSDIEKLAEFDRQTVTLAAPKHPPVEGDHFTVKVNGRNYDTVIDDHHVQRFVGNRVVRDFISGTSVKYNEWLEKIPLQVRNWKDAPFTLNDIDYHPQEQGGTYTLDELIEFSTLHGYSVSGMCDLSFMEGVEVDNPLWNE